MEPDQVQQKLMEWVVKGGGLRGRSLLHVYVIEGLEMSVRYESGALKSIVLQGAVSQVVTPNAVLARGIARQLSGAGATYTGVVTGRVGLSARLRSEGESVEGTLRRLLSIQDRAEASVCRHLVFWAHEASEMPDLKRREVFWWLKSAGLGVAAHSLPYVLPEEGLGPWDEMREDMRLASVVPLTGLMVGLDLRADRSDMLYLSFD
jgi:hypothetical protein